MGFPLAKLEGPVNIRSWEIARNITRFKSFEACQQRIWTRETNRLSSLDPVNANRDTHTRGCGEFGRPKQTPALSRTWKLTSRLIWRELLERTIDWESPKTPPKRSKEIQDTITRRKSVIFFVILFYRTYQQNRTQSCDRQTDPRSIGKYVLRHAIDSFFNAKVTQNTPFFFPPPFACSTWLRRKYWVNISAKQRLLLLSSTK